MDLIEAAEYARTLPMIQNATRLHDETCSPCGARPLMVFTKGASTYRVECPVCRRVTDECDTHTGALVAWHYDQTHPIGTKAETPQAIAA